MIDSGLNPGHPHLRGPLLSGLSLVPGEDTGDRLGHGTCVAAVIRWWAPEAELLPIRIFGERLECPVERAQLAVRLAREQGAHLINLSLASSRSQGWEPTPGLVAAAENGGPAGYPAALPWALGVQAGPRFAWVPGAPIEFIAPGLARPLGRRNFEGNSLAAAHLTGLTARLLAERPGADPRAVLLQLLTPGAREQQSPNSK